MAARQHGSDTVTAGLVNRYRATLGWPAAVAAEGDPAPPGVHWCLAPETTEAGALGIDGLPVAGGIIPPIRRLTSRMWAGGEIAFGEPLRVGDPVERVSRLVALAEKSGRSGRLVFATLQYDYRVAGTTRVAETQTIAFRDPAAAAPHARAPLAESPAEDWDFSRTVTTDSTMLFRFSALTFNPHRIHYDHPYATAAEGYPGILVHGTLTAALLLDVCASHVGTAAIAGFRVKAERPAFCGIRLTLSGRVRDAGIELVAIGNGGEVVMRGSATLRP